jgi:hypothetical protein
MVRYGADAVCVGYRSAAELLNDEAHGCQTTAWRTPGSREQMGI